MRKKHCFIFLVLFMSIATLAYALGNPALEGTLNVNISEDREHLEITYSVRNLTGNIIGPNPEEKYHYAIRNVETGEEVLNGNLDSAFQTAVSQYVSGYSHAVFALKRVAIPEAMRSNPGYYLIFLSVGPLSNGGEAVFYIPENLDGSDNPALYNIQKKVELILRKVNRIIRLLKKII